MTKMCIADIERDYTATVISSDSLRVENGASNFYRLSSAQSLSAGESVSIVPCFLKSILLGTPPSTAAALGVFDTNLADVSAFGTSGNNVIGIYGFETSGLGSATSANLENFPSQLNFNVFCASGLTISNSCSANDAIGRIGILKDITVIYQL